MRKMTLQKRSHPSVADRSGRAAPRIGYAVASLVGIFAILGGQLGLSIVLSDGAYQILSLERELNDRMRDLDVVSEDIGHMHDPQAVASLAVAMGMVQSRETSYLRLSDTAVIGESTPAGATTVSVIEIVPGEAEIVEEAAVTLAQATTDTDYSMEQAPGSIVERPAQVLLKDIVVQPLPVTVSTQTQEKKLGGDIPAPTTR